MILTALMLAAALGQSDTLVYSGRAGQTVVRPPRLSAATVIDGVLDEPQWRSAAVLTGFSQYSPVDGVAAADSTEILVWYSPNALHIGVRAFDASGAVHATLTNRDQIFGDDHVQILLSTFNDGRQATVFAVNPFGIQGDGAQNESGRGGGGGGFNNTAQTREGTDISQDFVWESKGHLTPGGYEVEIQIPFKSIRFQQAKTQTWGINIIRYVPRSGEEQTWTMTRRAAASFLSQSGKLEGLTELDAGHPLDVVPTLTSRVVGSSAASGTGWNYDGGKPEMGGNIRYGVTPNLTLNATANPDFSQVESDAGQFSFDPRQAIGFPERRPFFLDGIEQFDAPQNMIYTRRIVQPVFATKITGKVGGTQIGVLGAVDDKTSSRNDEHPIFGVVRLSRDLGPGSRLGMVWTEQHDGPDNNRVLGIDGRIVASRINSFTFWGAMSRNSRAGVVTTGPLWNVGYRRNGRAFRINYSLNGIGEDFRTLVGFNSRVGIGNATVSHSYVWQRPGRTLESLSAELALYGTWVYQDLIHGGPIQDRKMHFNFNGRFKGGWGAGVSVLDENFGYDPSIYGSYFLRTNDGNFIPFGDQARIPNRDYLVQGNTPSWKTFQMNAFFLWGHDENFYEWSSAPIIFATLGATYQPTEQLRVGLSYNHQQVNRRDGSRVSVQAVPRLRVQYQVTRNIQLRLISQYALEIRDSLHDDTRTNLPIYYAGPLGTFTRAAAFRNGNLRNDFLVSYFPNPGTVVYVGYGATHAEPVPEGKDGLNLFGRTFTRTSDGFFLKLSYLFRMRG
ncbi:MAG: DUF5916 domain-containing protein [Gemmatimonadota bacterium]